MLTAHYDKKTGLIRSHSSGFLEVEEVRRYLADLKSAVSEARRHSGAVRLLIDSTGSVVQSAEVMEEFMRAESLITGANDRMALIVPSSLSRIQASRNFSSDREKAFTSEAEALEWLKASEPSQP